MRQKNISLGLTHIVYDAAKNYSIASLVLSSTVLKSCS